MAEGLSGRRLWRRSILESTLTCSSMTRYFGITCSQPVIKRKPWSSWGCISQIAKSMWKWENLKSLKKWKKMENSEKGKWKWHLLSHMVVHREVLACTDERFVVRDQLRREISASRVLHGFKEGDIKFAPTFKVTFCPSLVSLVSAAVPNCRTLTNNIFMPLRTMRFINSSFMFSLCCFSSVSLIHCVFLEDAKRWDESLRSKAYASMVWPHTLEESSGLHHQALEIHLGTSTGHEVSNSLMLDYLNL